MSCLQKSRFVGNQLIRNCDLILQDKSSVCSNQCFNGCEETDGLEVVTFIGRYSFPSIWVL